MLAALETSKSVPCLTYRGTEVLLDTDLQLKLVIPAVKLLSRDRFLGLQLP